MDLKKYINRSKSNGKKIWLHKLPKKETLFDVIDKLREVYKEETLVFTEEINIIGKTIDKEVNFSNCIFKKDVDFSGCIFKKDVDFSGCTFNKKISFSYIKNNQEKIIAKASIFEKGVNFSKAIFKETVNFSGAKFGIKQEDKLNENNSEVKFLFENAKFQKEIDFSQAIFYDTIYFSETEFCTDIKEYKKESINFENAQFCKKVRFHHCKFHNTVRFENTSFNKLADFYSAHFHKAQQFHFTDFLDRAIFSNTEFDEEVQFLHCRVETRVSYIRFESTIFRRGLDISRSNFNNNINLWDIKIEEEGVLYIFNNRDNVKYKNDFEVQDKTPLIYNQIRETYRIIKDNFYKQNNKVEGLRFYEKEMSVYLEEKRAEDEKTEGFFSDVSTKVIKIKDQIKKASYNLQPFFTKLKNNIIISNLFVYTIPVIIDRKTRMGIKYVLLFFSVVSLSLYMIEKSYYWFWLLALALILLVLLKFYENRKSTREIVKQNNYISPLLLFIMTIIFLVIIYGQEDFKNDWAYKTIHWFLLQISKILNDQLGLSIVIIIALMSFAMLFIVVLREHDKITLWFNKNSNKFDTNWIAGVNFSILVGFITYFMVLLFMNNDIELDTSTEGISNFITSLVDVFNLTKWGDLKIIDIRLEGFPYLLLFIGRIFIGYGYYQTIQAFRKFGKS
ncbi:pentapeptide repeat-containing protein [Capnocytophaga genosp. AHN8471]|uniref:pentapeptide repeat-containing protein n=1 Tax=Capnocytophaga genosp. AHN8471 TaxID=327574 RepID=UPI0019340300|nr:pentapeptide repeat-containing protein [Capnocytophaga genosp. AHN8471]MBM0658394.1 pentapeptide repeat-containing protein [Capnocytophaga genosp. AHN8471]